LPKVFADAMHGRIEVQNKPEGGAQFFCLFTSSNIIHSPIMKMSNTILIVDDEPQIRRLLQINLESNQYKVVLAATAKEGLMLAASHQPDLILLDLGLPDKSGQELVKRIDGNGFTKPVIILSVAQ
jgi:response regulator RpfG family c-di-GMP phosphodiesterase